MWGPPGGCNDMTIRGLLIAFPLQVAASPGFRCWLLIIAFESECDGKATLS
jgi:hypothetical protein